MDERVLKGQGCIDEGAHWLAENFPEFKQALAQTGQLPLRFKSDGFPALLDAIVGQQISVAAARAIWARLEEAGFTNAAQIAVAGEEALRECGLSKPKASYAFGLAQTELDFPALHQKSSEEVIDTLVKLRGIGRWSAEIYAMFSLRRADVFASGDLALQETARVLFDLPERPKEKEMAKMAEAWSPWRAVAARALWAYYRVEKNREGIK